MNAKKLFLAIVAFSCISQVAQADDTGLTKQYSVCMDKSNGVTMDMIDCITAEVKHQDARLNKAYKEVISQLAAPRKKQLQAAQQAWIKFRDANCDFYYDPDGGSLAKVNANSCILSATASRAAELESFKEQ